MYAFVCTFMYMCIWMPEVDVFDVGCFLYCASHYFLGVGSLMQPGTHLFDNNRWTMSPKDLPLSASTVLELLADNHCLTFYVGAGNLSSVFRLI